MSKMTKEEAIKKAREQYNEALATIQEQVFAAASYSLMLPEKDAVLAAEEIIAAVRRGHTDFSNQAQEFIKCFKGGGEDGSH